MFSDSEDGCKASEHDSELESIELKLRSEALFVDTEVHGGEKGNQSKAHSPSSSPTVDSASADTRTLRRLWEQRIEEHDARRRRESSLVPQHHASSSSTLPRKHWKPSEVLSACLLAVHQDQSEPQSSCIDTVYYQSARKLSSREALFTYPIEYLSKVATGLPSGHSDPLDMEDTVVHESIADAARTRHMWQQMAATQLQHGHQDGRNNFSRSTTPASINSISGEFQQQQYKNGYDTHPRNGYAHQANGGTNGHHDGQQYVVKNGQYERNGHHQPEPVIHYQKNGQDGHYRTHGHSSNGGDYYRNGTTTGKSYQIDHQLIKPPPPHQPDNRRAISPSAMGPTGGLDSPLENEKRVFMAYVLSHPEVIGSLGISVPWQARQKYQQYAPPPNVRVELAVVGGGMDEYHFNGGGGSVSNGKPPVNGRSASVGAVVATFERENGHHNGGGSNGIARQPPPPPQPVTGRYIKNGHTPTPSTNGNHNGQCTTNNGWQKRIVRRQSQTVPDQPSQPIHQKITINSATMPRQWKTAQWNDPQSPVNKSIASSPSPRPQPPPPPPPNGGFVDESGHVYKSLGESIIAKEIREYREREEELRRSRSELGLPSLEDMLDTWRDAPPPVKPNGRAQSVDHLHAAVESERSVLSPSAAASNRNRSGSMDRLHRFQNGNAAHRSASVDPNVVAQDYANQFTPIENGRYHTTTQNHSPKNAYEKFLQMHAREAGIGGHKVAAYPPQQGDKERLDDDEDEQPVFSPISGRRKSGGDFLPMEARIEQEVEELRRREEELRLERQAAGMQYTPIGIQASPLAEAAATSPTHSASSNLSIGNQSSSNASAISREYVHPWSADEPKQSKPLDASPTPAAAAAMNEACMMHDANRSHVAFGRFDDSAEMKSNLCDPNQADRSIDHNRDTSLTTFGSRLISHDLDVYKPRAVKLIVDDERDQSSDEADHVTPSRTLSLVNDHLMETVPSKSHPTEDAPDPFSTDDQQQPEVADDNDQWFQVRKISTGEKSEKEGCVQKWNVDDILVSI